MQRQFCIRGGGRVYPLTLAKRQLFWLLGSGQKVGRCVGWTLDWVSMKIRTFKMSLVEIILFFFLNNNSHISNLKKIVCWLHVGTIRQTASTAVFSATVKYTFCTGVYISFVPVHTSFCVKPLHSLDKPGSQDMQPCGWTVSCHSFCSPFQWNDLK